MQIENLAERSRTTGTQTSAAEIQFHDVTKSFGSGLAVSDLTLEIRAGEFLTLLGPSGSGKSTLLMMLAGFEQPSSGVIRIGAQDMAGVPANRRNQGVVFQGYALFPHMTVEQNLAYPLAARGIQPSEREPLIGKALERVRMSAFRSRYPRQLSGGQQQRVALARAIVYESPLLLMDESLSALDRKLREEMQIELKALHQELGCTIVYVTHDQDEALTMSDRVAILSQGRISQLGTPSELYDQPENSFVASFLGDSNLIPVTFKGGAGQQMAESSNGTLLPVRPPKDAKIGEKLLVLMRPEKITLSMLNSAKHPSSEHSILGRVKSIAFAGDANKYVVQTPLGEIKVKIPRSETKNQLSVGSEVIATKPERESVAFRP